MTAKQYDSVNQHLVHIYRLWDELRFIRPIDMHPDDYRVLYPIDAGFSDEEIREQLKRTQSRLVPA